MNCVKSSLSIPRAIYNREYRLLFASVMVYIHHWIYQWNNTGYDLIRFILKRRKSRKFLNLFRKQHYNLPYHPHVVIKGNWAEVVRYRIRNTDNVLLKWGFIQMSTKLSFLWNKGNYENFCISLESQINILFKAHFKTLYFLQGTSKVRYSYISI